MKKLHLVPTILSMAIVATLISACSTVPKTTSLLDQTRTDYVVIQNNPNVERYAPMQMQQATTAMNLANVAADKRDSDAEIDRLAHIADDKIGEAREVTKQKLAEAEIARTAKERDQMILNQRTAEADQAKANAAQAQLAAQSAQANAAASQADAAASQARTAQLEVELAALSAKKTDRGIVITLSDVLFGTDQSRLNPNGMATAQKLADLLNQNPSRNVLIEGYTDNTGTATYNLDLSERRAESVRHALQDMGVSVNRVSIRGYGKEFPVASNDNAGDRQLNRRVEIILSDDSGKIIQR
jgi:outer membrane protein OmpA-like peptidoglycan-associated protein